MTEKKTDANFQFAKTYTELESIVRSLETEKVDLDESVKKFERGLQLAKQLKSKLKDVEQKIETIKQKFDVDENLEGNP